MNEKDEALLNVGDVFAGGGLLAEPFGRVVVAADLEVAAVNSSKANHDGVDTIRGTVRTASQDVNCGFGGGGSSDENEAAELTEDEGGEEGGGEHCGGGEGKGARDAGKGKRRARKSGKGQSARQKILADFERRGVTVRFYILRHILVETQQPPPVAPSISVHMHAHPSIYLQDSRNACGPERVAFSRKSIDLTRAVRKRLVYPGAGSAFVPKYCVHSLTHCFTSSPIP